MTDTRYDIVFRGETLPDFDPSQVEQVFAETFSLAREKAAKVFKRSSTTLKKNLDQVTAARYQARLAALGMKVELVNLTPAPQMTTADIGLAPGYQSPNAPGDSASADAQSGNPGAGAASVEQERPEPRHSPFRFSGTGNEYFGIWLVNILLTVLTLGIYSAWAKVRDKQFFYGHTDLEGSRFDYTADPKRILLGRAIALVFFIAYTVALELSLASAIIAWVLFLAFLPWAMRQSLRFNARYSLYRNVPFRFEGSLFDAFKAFIVWPLFAMLSLGTLFPMALQRQQAYIIGNHSYGTRRFKFSAPVRAYYGLAFRLLIWLALGAAQIALITVIGWVPVIPLVGLALYFVLMAVFSVTLANLKYNHTTLARHSFTGYWETGSYTQLLVVNSLLTVLTLGFFIPWAKVRAARYAAEHTEAQIAGELDRFTRAEAEKTSTLAEGIGDLFDLDVGA